MDPFVFNLRATLKPHGVDAYSRNHKLELGKSIDFDTRGERPNAMEALLAAFAADVLDSLKAAAARSRIHIDQAEIVVSATLGNPLVAIGVVGEKGSAAIESIAATAYVQADATPEDLVRLKDEALGRAPIVQTLSKAANLRLSVEFV